MCQVCGGGSITLVLHLKQWLENGWDVGVWFATLRLFLGKVLAKAICGWKEVSKCQIGKLMDTDYDIEKC